jgi:hypothetical protein
MTSGKVFDRFVVVLLLLHHHHHLLLPLMLFLFAPSNLADKYELWPLRYCWNMESPKRQQSFFFFSFFFCVGPCPVTFKVLSWRLSFSCYRQSVVVAENFFSLLWVTFKVCCCCGEWISFSLVGYLPSNDLFSEISTLCNLIHRSWGMNNLTTTALWIAQLLLELDFPECNWLLGFLESECCFVIMLQVIGEGSALHFLQLDASQVGFTFSAVAS